MTIASFLRVFSGSDLFGPKGSGGGDDETDEQLEKLRALARSADHEKGEVSLGRLSIEERRKALFGK